jgi:hypothetical protein
VKYSFGTLRPSGSAGDRDLGTGISGTFTNSGGSPQSATVATAPVAFVPGGLAGIALDGVLFSVAVSKAIDAGVTITSGPRVIWIYNTLEGQEDITADGTVQDLPISRLEPAALPWTGTKLQATTVKVEMDVLVPAGKSATIMLLELFAEAVTLAKFMSGGSAGDLVSEGVA